MQPSICNPVRAQSVKKSIYAIVKFGTQDVRMLVDSGSTDTVLHPKVWQLFPQDLRDKLEPHLPSVTAANGELLKIHGVSDLDMQLGKVKVTHPVLVADIEPAGILGNDFLDAFEGIVNVRKGTVTVLGRQIPVVCETSSSHCCRIAAVNTTTIQPGQEVIIPGRMVSRRSSGMGCGGNKTVC